MNRFPPLMQFFLIIGSIVAAAVLIRIWTGVMNVKIVEEESISTIESKHPYLPKFGAIILSCIVAGVLLLLSLKYGKQTSLASFTESSAFVRTLVVFLGIVGFGLFDQARWKGSKDRYKYFYAFVLGTIVSWILIQFKRSFFEYGLSEDPFLMALGVTCVIIGWKFMFGPWSSSMKATVLGTFIFWVAFALLRHETSVELLVTGIAALAAIIPVSLWCWLFLGYHKERLSSVILAFFSGMMSTAPILFYSEFAKRSIELNFFLFKVTSISFSSSSEQFAKESLLFDPTSMLQTAVLTGLVTYLIVGVIEEVSKYWVLKHSGSSVFRSIDDVLQLSIIVALGFAFAENLLNPNYFVGFVQQYILGPFGAQWGAFFASVIGRAVLTTMVHVLSTGVLGYYFGVSLFGSQVLRERFEKGRAYHVLRTVHDMLQLPMKQIFSQYYRLLGLLLACVLHGIFDFIVTLPEILPGNPQTVGAILGQESDSILSGISITLLPSILYVVGGFWLLTWLFEQKENVQERGQIMQVDAVVQ